MKSKAPKKDNLVHVGYYYYYEGDDYPNVRKMAEITRGQAQQILRLVRNARRNPRFNDPDARCIFDMDVDYTEMTELQPGPYEVESHPHLKFKHIRVCNPKCGTRAYAKFKCLKNLAAGECKDEFMQRIGAILYPDKYPQIKGKQR